MFYIIWMFTQSSFYPCTYTPREANAEIGIFHYTSVGVIVSTIHYHIQRKQDSE